MNNKGLLYAGVAEIETVSGKRVSLIDTDPDSITIEDIAHGLSMTCRWGGQIPIFFSVAQHSLCVHDDVPPMHKLGALLHDASEAYLGDMPKPYKDLMPDFERHEDALMRVIAKKFWFAYPLETIIKKADKDQLEAEWAWFRGNGHAPQLWTPETARRKFLAAYNSLTK